MGTISLVVEGTTVGTVAAGGGVTVAKQIAEADSARVITAFAAIYASQFLDENGQVRAPSIQEVVQAWFNDAMNKSIEQVFAAERLAAANAAVQTVVPVVLT